MPPNPKLKEVPYSDIVFRPGVLQRIQRDDVLISIVVGVITGILGDQFLQPYLKLQLDYYRVKRGK